MVPEDVYYLQVNEYLLHSRLLTQNVNILAILIRKNTSQWLTMKALMDKLIETPFLEFKFN